MQTIIADYQKTKKQVELGKKIFIAFFILSVSSLFLVESWIPTSILIALFVCGAIFIKVKENKRNMLLKEYENELTKLPIVRRKVKKVSIVNNGESAYIEFDNGDLMHKQVDVIKTHIKEPFFEEREMVAGIEEVEEMHQKFPLPNLFVPNKEVEAVIYTGNTHIA